MVTIARQLAVDWGTTGLDHSGTGALHYNVVDADNTDLIARTNVGVTEFPASSGSYGVKVAAWNLNWGAKIIWDDGTSFYTEWVQPPRGGDPKTVT